MSLYRRSCFVIKCNQSGCDQMLDSDGIVLHFDVSEQFHMEDAIEAAGWSFYPEVLSLTDTWSQPSDPEKKHYCPDHWHYIDEADD